MSPAGYTNGPDRPSSLRSLVMVLFKRKRIILSVFFSVVITVTVGTFLMPRIYRSTAKILVEREIDSEKALLFRMNFPLAYEKYDWIKSEIEIIKSYPLASRVVKGLGLDKIDQAARTLSQAEEQEQFEATVERFQKKLTVENTTDSNVFEVSYEARDPALAARTVNRVVETYLMYRSEIFDESDTYEFLEQQMRIADEKLRDLEKRQTSFKKEAEMISPQTQVTILQSKLADYEKRLTAVRTERIGKEARLAMIHVQMQQGSEIDIPAAIVRESPIRINYIARLKGELVSMEVKRDRFLQRFKPSYAELVALQKEIAVTKDKIQSEIGKIVDAEDNAIRAIIAEEQALQKAIDRINQEVQNFVQKEYEYAQLSRGIDDSREVYSMLLKQREEARISLAKLERGVKIKVISPAIVPMNPIKPRARRNVALAVFLGLVSGLGLAFFIEYHDHSINTAEELERYAGLTVLGSVRNVVNGGIIIR